MKNTDELMQYISTKQLDAVKIQDADVTEAERERINELVQNKLRNYIKPKRKIASKKLIISLIAAIVVITSITVFATNLELVEIDDVPYGTIFPSISDYFSDIPNEPLDIIHGDNYDYAITDIKGDDYYAKILIEVISKDGHALNGPYITVPSYAYINNYEETLYSVFSANDSSDILIDKNLCGIRPLKDDNINDNKTSFLLLIGEENAPKILGQNLRIDLGTIYQIKSTPMKDLDAPSIKQILKKASLPKEKLKYNENRDESAIQGFGVYFNTDFPDKSLEELTEAEKIKYDRTPYYFMPVNQVKGLPLSEQYHKALISGVYVDNKLHLRVDVPFEIKKLKSYEFPRIALKHKKTGQIIEPYFEVSSSNAFLAKQLEQNSDLLDELKKDNFDLNIQNYTFTFDVKEKDLKNWKIISGPEYVSEVAFDGELTLSTKLNYPSTGKTIPVNKPANIILEGDIYDDEGNITSTIQLKSKVNVENVYISNYTCIVEIDVPKESKLNQTTFTSPRVNAVVNYKSKEQHKIHQAWVDYDNEANISKITLHTTLNPLVNIDEITSIAVGDLDIPIT